MKKTIKSTIAVALAILCLFGLAACGDTTETSNTSSNLWENATYLTDTELGEGGKTITVEVKADEKTVTFKINTDETTVGKALLEHKLIDGEMGEFGLYVKVVNGMTADFDIDKSYWAFYIDGEYATSGVDTAEISESVIYQLVYSK